MLIDELFHEIAVPQDFDIVRMTKDADFKSDDSGKLTFVDLFKLLDFISQPNLSSWRIDFYRCTDDEQQMIQCLRSYLETMDVTDLTIPTTHVVTNVLMRRASDEFPTKIQKRDVFYGQVQFLFRKDIFEDETVLTLLLVEGDDLSESYVLQALQECSTLYDTFMMLLKRLRVEQDYPVCIRKEEQNYPIVNAVRHFCGVDKLTKDTAFLMQMRCRYKDIGPPNGIAKFGSLCSKTSICAGSFAKP